jgi:hypothetical protein
VRLSSTIHTPYILGKLSFGEERIGPPHAMILHMHVHEYGEL